MAKKVKSTKMSLAMKKSWAERKSAKVERPKPKVEPKFYILWMPSSHKPPRVQFSTRDKVSAVADIMVNKYRQPIYVMESVALHTLGKPEVVSYSGAEVVGSEPKAKPCPPETFKVSDPPVRQGQPWDQEQDDMLCMLWFQGIRDARVLAERMGRSELAIQYRLDALTLRPMND